MDNRSTIETVERLSESPEIIAIAREYVKIVKECNHLENRMEIVAAVLLAITRYKSLED